MRLLLASIVSAAVILAAPFAGQIRAAVQFAFPRQYVLIVGGSVATAVCVAVLVALARIRTRRAFRFGAIALALAVGAGYAVVTATGRPDVDAVERVHFVEYGLIALLFYRVWRHVGDPTMFIFPLLAALVVGTLDEWLQWFIPVRVGEARDVLLNLIATGCGLLFGVAVDPPPNLSWRLRAGSLSRAGLAAAGALLVFSVFVSAVHLGHLVQADGIGDFKSHYTAAELDALSLDRIQRWRTEPPAVLARLSREDQYMDEGLWHVRRRNETWSTGDASRAWSENAILERFFTPVLDTSTYASPEGNRWPPEQRADAETRARRGGASLVSDAEPYPIVTWPKLPFWLASILGASAIAALSTFFDRLELSDRNRPRSRHE
jgi:hypothetical protein